MSAAFFVLGWCKSNCGFPFVELCCLILEYLIKCSYVIPYFNDHFSLYVFFANALLLAVYLILILDYKNDVR